MGVEGGDTALLETYQSFFKKNEYTKASASGRGTVFYKLWLFLQDVLIVTIVFLIGYRFTDGSIGSPNTFADIAITIITGLISISFFVVMRLYSYHQIFSKTNHISLLFQAIGLGAISVALIDTIYQFPDFFNGVYLLPSMIVLSIIVIILSRQYSGQLIYLLLALGLSFIVTGFFGIIKPGGMPAIFLNNKFMPMLFISKVSAIVSCRLFTVQIVFNKILRRYFRRQVLIIGSNETSVDILNHIVSLNAPFWVTGFICNEGAENEALRMNKKNLGRIEDMPEIVVKQKVREVILTDEFIDKKTLIVLLDYCTSKRISIWFPPALMPIISLKLYIDNFCGLPMIRLGGHRNLALFFRLKCLIESLVATCISIVQLPLFLLISIAVKLTSEGPVFYKAKAIGKNGEIFSMYKFRSMRVNTDSRIHKDYVTKLIRGEIRADQNSNQPLKITNDPRVTRIGSIIRKYSLDELPQLINVLKGDMGLIGPRPCLPYEWEVYKDWHKKRSSIRPGVTGLWQVTGRSSVDFEDMILLDLYYRYNPSFTLDFNILLETFFVVIGKQGAF